MPVPPSYTNAIKSAANRTAYANAQAQSIRVPKLPQKIRRLDPEGAEQWENQMQQELDGFVSKLNAGVVIPISNTVTGLQRK